VVDDDDVDSPVVLVEVVGSIPKETLMFSRPDAQQEPKIPRTQYPCSVGESELG